MIRHNKINCECKTFFDYSSETAIEFEEVIGFEVDGDVLFFVMRDTGETKELKCENSGRAFGIYFKLKSYLLDINNKAPFVCCLMKKQQAKKD